MLFKRKNLGKCGRDKLGDWAASKVFVKHTEKEKIYVADRLKVEGQVRKRHKVALSEWIVPKQCTLEWAGQSAYQQPGLPHEYARVTAGSDF